MKYYSERLSEASKEVGDFNAAVAKYGLRIFERTYPDKEQDVTDARCKDLEDAVKEYPRNA